MRAILALALPLFLNSSIQAVLNLTDTWFIGRISATAVAAIASVHWLVVGFLLLFGGVAMGVQTFAAQATGAGRHRRAGLSMWSGIWASLPIAPLYVALAAAGPAVLPKLGVAAEITGLAVEYWQPRMLGGVLALLLWAPMSFFYGTGQIRIAVTINIAVALANAVFNELLMFRLGMGIAGAAWATNLSLAGGFVMAMAAFLRPASRGRYGGQLLWRPRRASVLAMYPVGLPIGAMIAFDLLGLAAFQLMMTQVGVVQGAATQIVMMLTSTVYMPGIGIALAGTTLVGQSIGAGDREWARRLGNAVIVLTTGFMGTIGVLLALAGPWLVPTFLSAGDPDTPAVVALGVVLLWIAAGYQIFDGLNLGSGFSLRGAGDVRLPAVLFFVLSWGVFVPLAHALSFAPGQGWVDLLPQFGFGALGGWSALLVYVVLLGSALWLRWRSGKWRQARI